MGQTAFDEFHEALIETIARKRAKKSVKAVDDDNDSDAASNNDDVDNSAAITIELATQPLANELPSTYREIPRKSYLSLIKLRRPPNQKHRASIRQQAATAVLAQANTSTFP